MASRPIQAEQSSSKTLSQAPPTFLDWAIVFLSPLSLLFIISGLGDLESGGKPGIQIVPLVWFSSLVFAHGIARIARTTRNFLPALLAFILAVLFTEAILRAYQVPPGLIPTPSRVWIALLSTQQVLLRDAYTTFVLEAVIGFIGGAVAGLLFALSIVRSRFLERGLLPYASVL